MYLSRFPRVSLAHLPTPLEPLPNLSQALGGPNLWIKRDDCTGLAGGGNKTRKLEFLVADALQHQADTLITQGATQSNHVRQTVAAAAKFGLKCHVLLEDRTGRVDTNHNHGGNVQLNKIGGATMERHSGGTDMHRAMEEAATKLSAQGSKPYIIPGGGSNAIGSLGYVNAALELINQVNSLNLPVDHLVHATGSSGTQAGLVAGFMAMHVPIPILGVGVRLPQAQQEANVAKTTLSAMALLDIQYADLAADIAERVCADCNYVGAGYGIPAPSTLEAIKMLAQLEGIYLDPVYSGKGMAGLIDLVRQGRFNTTDNIVFLHTGGAQALPGYLEDL